ncbi:hypothetical protein [Sphingomonas hengshuiensis]|uniref:hypothetical protein n=1 Tax=Sphingomonas hengshuiensis TaxID=1609977 RepID=UPI001D104FB2|nr:hypothetical protein [Sphingomonas hengshuiensis]
MRIDKAGAERQARAVDLADTVPGRKRADRGDAIAANRQIALKPGLPGAVDQFYIPKKRVRLMPCDDRVPFRASSLYGAQIRRWPRGPS